MGCQDKENQAETGNDDDIIAAPVHLSFQVVNQYPHDTSAFTEGFTFHEGSLFESTGAPDSPATSDTWIGSIDLKTGKADKRITMGKKYFGEGITFLNGKLYQLTWKNKKGFVYDAKTFKKLSEFNYKDEGWGLTNDGKNLLMSTGSSNIYYLTPDSVKFIKMLPVQDNNGYVENINELEFIGGFIYANKWLSTEILKIDPATGHVVGKFDLTKQVAEAKAKFPDAQEMNGIAYDSTTGKTYITGKKWPLIYEIKW
jgi:glutamine cyclotransferase